MYEASKALFFSIYRTHSFFFCVLRVLVVLV